MELHYLAITSLDIGDILVRYLLLRLSLVLSEDLPQVLFQISI